MSEKTKCFVVVVLTIFRCPSLRHGHHKGEGKWRESAKASQRGRE